MTLDQRIRNDLKTAAAAVPDAFPERLVNIKRRGLRRRRTRRAVWAVLTAIPILVFVAVMVPYDPNRIDPAATHDVDTVELADLAVSVVDVEPALRNPNVWLGLPGPPPRFDTSELGADLSFTPGAPEVDDLDDSVVEAVYVGDLDGEPFYLYSSNAGSIFDWFSEVIFGNPSGDIIGTTLDCCTGGDMDRVGGFPGVSGSQTGDEPPVIAAQWLGLSPDVSVVAYQFDGEFVGWQTPVGGISAIQPEETPGEYVLVAFDAQGRELDRFGPHEGPTFGDTATVSFILAREGVEIQPNDLPTEALRNVIDLTQTDRLFAVPTGEFQVFVVIPERGMPHTYATSCDVLQSADLLRWDGTCLERTVNGQRETGIFEHRSETE